jgi:hypothetical protein
MAAVTALAIQGVIVPAFASTLTALMSFGGCGHIRLDYCGVRSPSARLAAASTAGWVTTSAASLLAMPRRYPDEGGPAPLKSDRTLTVAVAL